MYALGALVVGIVLLYVFMSSVEGFANKNVISVYLKRDNSDNVTFVKSSDPKITASNTPQKNKFSLNIDESLKNKLIDYAVFGYNGGNNCKFKKGDPEENKPKNAKKDQCWFKAKYNRGATSILLKDDKGNIIPNNSKTPYKTINITSMTKNNLETSGSITTTDNLGIASSIKKLEKGANVRIDLTFS